MIKASSLPDMTAHMRLAQHLYSDDRDSSLRLKDSETEPAGLSSLIGGEPQ